MYRLKSLDRFEVAGRGTVFLVESPVTAQRTFQAMRAAIGDVVEIDGRQYEPINFEMNMPATPVRIGEHIGILVCSD